MRIPLNSGPQQRAPLTGWQIVVYRVLIGVRIGAVVSLVGVTLAACLGMPLDVLILALLPWLFADGLISCVCPVLASRRPHDSMLAAAFSASFCNQRTVRCTAGITLVILALWCTELRLVLEYWR